jgi:hypothetical protein
MTGMDEIREGDRVEYVGPPSEDVSEAEPGERGTVITSGDAGKPPRSWVVTFDRAGSAVYNLDELRKITDDG